jgi:hypothetical protein
MFECASVFPSYKSVLRIGAGHAQRDERTLGKPDSALGKFAQIAPAGRQVGQIEPIRCHNRPVFAGRSHHCEADSNR